MKVNLQDLELATDFVGSDSEAQAYLDTQTGYIYYVHDDLDEDVPEDISSERYLQIPSNKDLQSERDMIFRFVRQELPDEFERIDRYFSKRGAYANFRSRIEALGVLEQWYRFKNDITVQNLKAWCDDHSLNYDDPTA